MRSPRVCDFDINDVIDAYLGGDSEKAIAERIGHSRNVVARVLRDAGVERRSRSDSMYVRMGKLTPEERRKNALAAQVARRGSHDTPDTLARRAKTKSRRVGKFEREFCDVLSSAGFNIKPQRSFLSYNLDIGCGNVAVEIHVRTSNPLTGVQGKKVMNCLHAGLNMIYVWIDPRKPTVSDSCYAKVVSLVEEIGGNPSAHGEYRVVRGTGKLYAAGRLITSQNDAAPKLLALNPAAVGDRLDWREHIKPQ